jgi:hypothetical protein
VQSRLGGTRRESKDAKGSQGFVKSIAASGRERQGLKRLSCPARAASLRVPMQQLDEMFASDIEPSGIGCLSDRGLDGGGDQAHVGRRKRPQFLDLKERISSAPKLSRTLTLWSAKDDCKTSLTHFWLTCWSMR